jgi:hypothetical protein
MQNTPAYNYVNKCRDNATSGGGVAIGIDRILTYRDLTNAVLPVHLRE